MANASSSSVQDMRMFSTRVKLPEDRRQRLAELLNVRLADTLDLYTQTKQAHWNVKGENFYQLHELFDDIATMILPHADMLAERATALGGVALGTARLAAQASTVEELPLDMHGGMDLVQALADRYGRHGNNIRDAIDTAADLGDQGTADLFTEVVRDVDKALYFLESHLQGR